MKRERKPLGQIDLTTEDKLTTNNNIHSNKDKDIIRKKYVKPSVAQQTTGCCTTNNRTVAQYATNNNIHSNKDIDIDIIRKTKKEKNQTVITKTNGFLEKPKESLYVNDNVNVNDNDIKEKNIKKKNENK